MSSQRPGSELEGPPEGPPGGGVFSLEGRQTPGLYLVAWILTVGGLGLTFLIGPMASDATASVVLTALGALTVMTGLAAGAGSQILDRRDRHPNHYRGPSPLLAFLAYTFALAALGLGLVSAGLADPDDPAGFLWIGLLQVLGYVAVVWLFAVRSGALSWRQMGWLTWSGTGLWPVLRAIGVAVAVVLPATVVLLVATGILSMVLGVEPPDVVPVPTTGTESFAIAVAAGLLIPFGEELFFRGFALTAWMRDLGARTAIIRSAVFFALIHIVNVTAVDFGEGLAIVLLQTAIILPLGLLLGWLFVRHGAAAAVAGHAAYNSLLMAIWLLSMQLPPELTAPT